MAFTTLFRVAAILSQWPGHPGSSPRAASAEEAGAGHVPAGQSDTAILYWNHAYLLLWQEFSEKEFSVLQFAYILGVNRLPLLKKIFDALMSARKNFYTISSSVCVYKLQTEAYSKLLIYFQVAIIF